MASARPRTPALSPGKSGNPAQRNGGRNPLPGATRERGVYSDAVGEAPDLADVTLGTTLNKAQLAASSAFDAALADDEPDLTKSTALLSRRFPEGATNPKVQIPYAPRPGQTPREIAVRRKRREYEQHSLPALLEARGVYCSLGTEPDGVTAGGAAATRLELQRFDDEEYEQRSPEAWLALGRDAVTVTAAAPPVGGDSDDDGSDAADGSSEDRGDSSATVTAQGEMRGLPALGLKLGPMQQDVEDEIGCWVPCIVRDYDAGSGLWAVEWDGAADDAVPPAVKAGDAEAARLPMATTATLPRLQLMFLAEDPINFADRVAAAHAARRRALQALRYQLYIDCMPTEDLPTWDMEQTNRVLALSLTTPKLRRFTHDSTSLFQEVDTTYKRALNKLALDARLREMQAQAAPAAPASAATKASTSAAAADTSAGAQEMLSAMGGHAMPLPASSPPPAPAKGVVRIPVANFAENFSNMCFNSLLTKSEVIRAMKGLRWECNRVLEMRMLKVGISKPLPHDEFDSVQEVAAKTANSYLRDGWCAQVKGILEAELRDAGKGWFNLAESDYQVYNLGKLRALLTYCDLMMRDTLRSMLQVRSARARHLARSAARFAALRFGCACPCACL